MISRPNLNVDRQSVVVNCLSLVGMVISSLAFAANWYVDGAKSAGTGERESPFKTIGAAIRASKDGDTIRIARGVYAEKVVLLKSGVKLRGGYDSTFQVARDPQQNETVIDGQKKFRPLQIGDESTAVDKFQIDSLTVRQGLADGSEGVAGKGGGILIEGTSSGKIIDCRIVDNRAMDDGGGIESGGAGTLKIDRCLFSGNSAADDGGAIRLQNSHSTTTISNCVFANNTGLDKYVVQAKGNVRILNCTFVGNTSADRGVIASRAKADTPDMVIAVTNCIFANNNSERRRPMLFADGGYEPIVCTNCLFFQNKASGGLGVQVGSDGNLQSDPLFADAAKKDFRLKSGSPAIDQGVAIEGIKKDFAGQPRSQGAGMDMGAFEFTPSAVVKGSSP